MPGHPTARGPEAATGHARDSSNGWGVAEAGEGTRGVASGARAEGAPRELCSADLVFRPGPQSKVAVHPSASFLTNGPTALFLKAPCLCLPAVRPPHNAMLRPPCFLLKDVLWCTRVVPGVQAPSLDLSSLRFGAQFTAHMLQVEWTREQGWGAPLIGPVGPVPMHPAAAGQDKPAPTATTTVTATATASTQLWGPDSSCSLPLL